MCRIEVKGPAHFSFYYFSLLSITVGGFSHEKNISSIFQCKRNNHTRKQISTGWIRNPEAAWR